jgi:hypothetical protein
MTSIAVYITMPLVIKVHGRIEVNLHAAVTSVTDRDECLSFSFG